MTSIEQLYRTLNQRIRPEDAAEMVQELLRDDLASGEYAVLDKAANGSLVRNAHRYTSMLQHFAEPIGAGKQVARAIEIFKPEQTQALDYNDPQHIESFIKLVSPLIQKAVGHNDFRSDRLNKSERIEKGMDISKRSYNKQWRVLRHLEKKLSQLIRQGKRCLDEPGLRAGRFFKTRPPAINPWLLLIV